MAGHLAHHGKAFNAKYIFNNWSENPETGEHTATAFLSPEHLAGAFGGSSDGDFLAADGSEINKITIHDVGGLPKHSHCGIVMHHGEPGEDNFSPISTDDRHLVVDDSNPSVDGFHFSYSQSNATHSDSVNITHSKLADPKVLLAREDRWQGVLPEHVTAGVKTVSGDHPSGNGTSVTRIAIPKEHNGVQNGMYQLIESNKYVAFAVLLRANAAAPAPDARGYSSPVCPTLRPVRFKRSDPTPCRTIPYFRPKAQVGLLRRQVQGRHHH